MYRRFRAAAIGILLLFGLSACGGAETSNATAPPADISLSQDMESSSSSPSETPTAENSMENDTGTEIVSQKPEVSTQVPEISTVAQAEEPSSTEPSQAQPVQTVLPASETQPEETGSKVLIAYFTWAENTVMKDPSAVDVDATTSASVLAPGHVAQMASWIQAETGGDLFSIVTEEPYSSNYDECLDRATDEKADNARPALTGSVANMADYDVIFLGYPDWWSTCPMAVFTFLNSYDFTGKIMIPFCAHGTSGLASSVRDIKSALPSVTVLDAVGVQRPGMDTPLDTARSTVTNWLANLEY